MTRKKEKYIVDPRVTAEEELFRSPSSRLDLDMLCQGFIQGRAGESFSLMELAAHLGVDMKRAAGVLYKHKDMVGNAGWLNHNNDGKRIKLFNSRLPQLPPSEDGAAILRKRQELRQSSPERQEEVKRSELLAEGAREDLWRREVGARKRKAIKASRYSHVFRIRNARDQEEFNRKYRD